MPEQKSHNCVNLKISILFRTLTAGMMMSQINLTYSLETEEKHKTSVIIVMTCIILVYFFFCLLNNSVSTAKKKSLRSREQQEY